MRRTIALLLGLPAAACAQTADNSQTTVLSESWLIGSWVPVGESCESDAGMIYNADRTWNAEGTIGTWRIERDKIVTVVTQQEDDAAVMQNIAPGREEQRIEAVRPDGFVSHMADGSVLRWVRCPRVPTG